MRHTQLLVLPLLLALGAAAEARQPIESLPPGHQSLAFKLRNKLGKIDAERRVGRELQQKFPGALVKVKLGNTIVDPKRHPVPEGAHPMTERVLRQSFHADISRPDGSKVRTLGNIEIGDETFGKITFSQM